MKDEFSSLNSKVNYHANAIKTLEGQLSLLSAQLKPKIMIEDDDRELAVVTLSGKVAIGNVMENEDVQKHEEGEGMEEQELLIHKNLAKEPQKEVEQHVQIPKVMQPLPKIPPPFPQCLKKKNKDEKFKKFFAIMTKELIKKREDPRAFTIPCTIGMLQFAKALCDLGASINLMPYAIYKQLGLGEPKATTMRLLMADCSIKHPMGILYDILVKVDRFIFSSDFVILDCEIEAEIPIILGRPFLATGRTLVDVEREELRFRVNEDEVTLNICKSMKHPSDIHVAS
ncbi:uncharacterized protein LOC125859006 [Solanum stenotomum]|uniref:uncharacterized protein LOC125859006 n=1 Tax=Solanum stenotomum TaxID=172797 RepID=UPI0020D06326|nr:uncharacterized protein LOC125859006 [Solanum stenotomum]